MFENHKCFLSFIWKAVSEKKNISTHILVTSRLHASFVKKYKSQILQKVSVIFLHKLQHIVINKSKENSAFISITTNTTFLIYLNKEIPSRKEPKESVDNSYNKKIHKINRPKKCVLFPNNCKIT